MNRCVITHLGNMQLVTNVKMPFNLMWMLKVLFIMKYPAVLEIKACILMVFSFDGSHIVIEISFLLMFS